MILKKLAQLSINREEQMEKTEETSLQSRKILNIGLLTFSTSKIYMKQVKFILNNAPYKF